jgi:hypothetical protein
MRIVYIGVRVLLSCSTCGNVSPREMEAVDYGSGPWVNPEIR